MPKLSHVLQLRLDDEQWAYLEDLSRDIDTGFSAAVRYLIDARLDDTDGGKHPSLRELAREEQGALMPDGSRLVIESVEHVDA